MKHKKLLFIIFTSFLILIITLFTISMVKTNIFNSKAHQIELSSTDLFTSNPDENLDVSVNVTYRDSWNKAFDFDNVGNTDFNYQGHTYDFIVKNNTTDKVKSFRLKVIFNSEAYISSAWNGSIEFHQKKNDGEIVETIPDLRNYKPSDYNLNINIVESGNEFEQNLNLVVMQKKDYLIYIPSESITALEVPISSLGATTPGINLFTKIDEKIIDSFTVSLEYYFFRAYTTDALFWVSSIGMILWLIVLIVVIILSLQIRKYRILHERDKKIIDESIETFTGFIDAKDPYTNGHSKRVAIYTRLIAERLGFTGEELERMYYIGLLHDCGKIGVPDNILGKAGKLTDEEFEIIKSHTVRGGEILTRFKSLDDAFEGALHHHERYDGKGYPDGLKGEEIPLIARIICVADSFDAMNSNRVYRKKISKEYIIDELENNKGTQFDPKIADVMLELIKEGKVSIDD